MQRSPVFLRIPLGDEFKISSLNQEIEISFVYSLECFSVVLLRFGWQGRGYSKSFLCVFDVVLVVE